MLPKGPYNPQENEKEILEGWLGKNMYKPETTSNQKLATNYVVGEDVRETYTNILPPPNANGNLHLGHMSGYAYQDLMGRYQRMRGKKVLLLPGKDHAGIQTEVVFEEELEKKGLKKRDIGREEFYKQCYDFCMEKAGIARQQEKNLGLSADFDRELFTLNPKIVDEVLKTFIDMYHDDLIYRDKRLINWCVRCQSALADIDTEYKDSVGTFVWFKYGFTKPDEYAVEIKNKYSGKEVEVEIERNKGMKHGEFEWQFDYYGHVDGDINKADGEELDVILIGFEEGLKIGTKVKGKAIGLMLRLDRDFKLIVANTENPDLDIDKEIRWHFEEFRKWFAGVDIKLFEKYPEDRFYNLGFTIGTVRPETKFGDTAVAVHPDDKRYADFVDKTFEVVTLNGPAKIKIIADRAADPEFGTGALKVTPAHAKEDWDIATRHPEVLPEKQVIGFDGKLNHLTGKYEGMTVNQARKEIIPDMDAIGMLVQVDENYENRTQICERCKSRIEPLISYQWFLDTRPLKAKAKQLVGDDFTNIMPEGKESVYLNWMENDEDWCITRQLWWGYRVPVWYKEQPKEYITETGEVKEQIGGKIMHSREDYKEFMEVRIDDPKDGSIQDEDVLDTWFSSGQWPAVTLLAQDGDFKQFYPTQNMETGWDILIFWVTRMMLLCPYKADKVYEREGMADKSKDDKNLTPFENVYLHGLVLDKNGVKMSKSKKNGIDPFEMMQKYGTDALRLSFIVGNKVGQNYRLYEEKIASFRNFCNKLWNVSKFILMNLGEDYKIEKQDDNTFTDDDRAMITHIDELCAKITRNMDNFQFGIAAQDIIDSMWHEFADKYIEAVKGRTFTKDRDGNEINTSGDAKKSRGAALWTLWYCLDKYLRLLHPFIPFITERLWQEMPKVEDESETLMYTKWYTMQK